MRTSAAGSKHGPALVRGFTLLELLVVVALISALERDATRLAALLETARAQARASGLPVVWRSTPTGFVFEGLPPPGLPQRWLSEATRTTASQPVVLGPEPLIPPQSIALTPAQGPSLTLWVSSDGLRPFRVQRSPEWTKP